MAIKYNDLYMDLRRRLREAGAEDATQAARELVCTASGKTKNELLRDGLLYASPEVERAAYYENLKLPAELDYAQVSALSFEVRQKLARHKPETLGQASRISGVTPAAISLLLIHLRKGRFKGFAANTESVSDAA